MRDMEKPLMATYARQPVAFVRGEGAYLWDEAGRRYLDAISGIAVCGLGHAHPELAGALAEQARTLLHTSNVYRIPLQEQLGARLTALSGMDNAFFCNSGAEANEALIKLARLHGHDRGIDAPAIIVMENSFHGRTMATLSATGNGKVQAGFEPLVQGFIRVPYGDIAALRSLAARRDVAAVLVEPIQGEGGVNIPPVGYLQDVRALCHAQGWLLLLDEVQTGMCRTGRWFACPPEGVTPDAMALAKSLGNGVPIGCCLASGPAAELMKPGKHGSTFGGNPLACRAALTVVGIMERDRPAAPAGGPVLRPRGARAGHDDRRATGSALQRAGEAGPRRRAAHQRDGGFGGAAAAAAHLRRDRGEAAAGCAHRGAARIRQDARGGGLMGAVRHFLTLFDCGAGELQQILERGIALKAARRAGAVYEPMKNRVLGMVFEKSSTRTRISFEAAMGGFAGHAIFLSPRDTQLGRG